LNAVLQKKDVNEIIKMKSKGFFVGVLPSMFYKNIK